MNPLAFVEAGLQAGLFASRRTLCSAPAPALPGCPLRQCFSFSFSFLFSANSALSASGAIVPEKIDGKYWMYWLGTAPSTPGETYKTDQMGLSYSTDLIHWTEATTTPVLPRRAGKFDSRVVEPGPLPILTEQGIVLIYNGADDNLVYRTGIAIFDRNDPRKLLSRSDTPIFAPEKEWEKVGQVPNVVFVEGMVQMKERFLFYYGAADKYIGVAEARAVTP